MKFVVNLCLFLALSNIIYCAVQAPKPKKIPAKVASKPQTKSNSLNDAIIIQKVNEYYKSFVNGILALYRQNQQKRQMAEKHPKAAFANQVRMGMSFLPTNIKDWVKHNPIWTKSLLKRAALEIEARWNETKVSPVQQKSKSTDNKKDKRQKLRLLDLAKKGIAGK